MPPVTTELSVLELYLYTYNAWQGLCYRSPTYYGHTHNWYQCGVMRHVASVGGFLMPPVTYDVGLLNLKITSETGVSLHALRRGAT